MKNMAVLYQTGSFLGGNSLDRTTGDACTAIDTLITDLVLGIACRNSVNRTFVNASTARNTFTTDNMSHSFTSNNYYMHGNFITNKKKINTKLKNNAHLALVAILPFLPCLKTSFFLNARRSTIHGSAVGMQLQQLIVGGGHEKNIKQKYKERRSDDEYF